MIKNIIKKIVKVFIELVVKFTTYKNEKKNIKRKSKLFKNIELSNEEIREVEEIWIKNYGKKFSLDWHKLYMSYTGKFDKYYFPEILFTTKLLDILNPRKTKLALADKILINSLFADIKDENYRSINNYIYNCNGYYYDKDGIITYKQAIEKLNNIGEVIIKPTTETSSGKNVQLLNIIEGKDVKTERNLCDILEQYNKNFTIQEKIVQHKLFSQLNPSSVNTIRINTYICEDKVYCAPIAMKMGRNGNIVDNGRAGGVQIGVKEDGTLRKFAFTEYGEKFDRHPDTNIVFENYKIPKIRELIEFTKKYHYKVPHIGIIAWDLAIDENGKIIIIEANICAPSIWFPQYVNGEAFFGENTEKMIKMIKRGKKNEK